MAAVRARAAVIAVALAAALGDASGAAAGWTHAERAELARDGRASPLLVEALDVADAASVIVAFAGPTGLEAEAARAAVADRVLARLAPGELRVSRRYRALTAFAGRASRQGVLGLLASPEVLGADLNRPVHAQLAEAVPMTGLAELHGEGHRGAGQVIAVIDTGIADAHEDLSGARVAEQCFCEGASGASGCCPNGLDEQSGPGAAADRHGHGTQVAGVLRSNGTSAPVGGAPGASLVAVKTLPDSGPGTFGDLLLGLDWILTEHPDVTVVNMSLGGGLYAGDCDAADATTMALSDAIGQLRARGTLAVAGSGNDQSGVSMIAPACIANAISVGAVWDLASASQSWFGCTDAPTVPDQVTCFSNSNASTDLFAPGGVITTSWWQGGTTLRAGTSYATPLVSACVALVLAARPGLHPDAVEGALELSSTLVTDTTNGLVFPRLECAESLHRVGPVPALGPVGLAVLAALLLAAASAA